MTFHLSQVFPFILVQWLPHLLSFSDFLSELLSQFVEHLKMFLTLALAFSFEFIGNVAESAGFSHEPFLLHVEGLLLLFPSFVFFSNLLSEVLTQRIKHLQVIPFLALIFSLKFLCDMSQVPAYLTQILTLFPVHLLPLLLLFPNHLLELLSNCFKHTQMFLSFFSCFIGEFFSDVSQTWSFRFVLLDFIFPLMSHLFLMSLPFLVFLVKHLAEFLANKA